MGINSGEAQLTHNSWQVLNLVITVERERGIERVRGTEKNTHVLVLELIWLINMSNITE